MVEPVKVVPRIISSAPKALPEPAPSTTRPSVEAPRQLSTQPVASSSRPTIKLKVGAQSKAEDEPSSKPAKRKTKVSESPSSHTPDAPPPPYVDDGSHDILQEVLAIEREKNQQRQRTISEKEKAVPSVIPTKRKKIDDVDDDDILELVAPVKRGGGRGPSPPEPSSSTSISIRKPTFSPSVKIKKDKVSDVPRPPTTSSSPGTSLKGKEKEVASTPPAGSNKPRKPVQYTTINEKKCKDLLKVLGKVPESYLFARPVDPVIDGCPTCVFVFLSFVSVFKGWLRRYYDEIQHPMDFGTMLTKLNENKYQFMEQFKEDIELVFSNCRQFNTPDTYPTKCAAIVEKVFKKEWPKTMERKLSWTEKRGLQGIMTTLVKEPMSVHFTLLSGSDQLNLF